MVLVEELSDLLTTNRSLAARQNPCCGSRIATGVPRASPPLSSFLWPTLLASRRSFRSFCGGTASRAGTVAERSWNGEKEATRAERIGKELDGHETRTTASLANASPRSADLTASTGFSSRRWISSRSAPERQPLTAASAVIAGLSSPFPSLPSLRSSHLQRRLPAALRLHKTKTILSLLPLSAR